MFASSISRSCALSTERNDRDLYTHSVQRGLGATPEDHVEARLGNKTRGKEGDIQCAEERSTHTLRHLNSASALLICSSPSMAARSPSAPR